ncbi:MAG: hypothetical protein ACLFRY_05555 [Spirochaetia bacterium]
METYSRFFRMNALLLVLFCTGALFLISTSLPAAEENPEVYTSILIAVVPTGENPNPDLEDLISEALQVEFQRAGLEVTILTDLPNTDAPLSREDILPVARTEDFDIVGTCSYLEEETGIHIEIDCGDVRRPEISVLVSKTTTVNLSLDTIFTAAVGEIIDRLETKIPGENFDPDRPREDGYDAEESRRGGGEPVGEIYPSREPAPRERTERFYLSVGSAPFIALGKTNLYFSLGALSSIHGNYIFPTPLMDIGLGLYAGLNYFSAGGLLISSSNNFLLPLGLDIHLSTSSRRFLRVFIHVTGGMSLFLFLPESSPVLTKIIPYFSAGVGTNFQFQRLIGIELDVSYFMFFEQYYPIMGIAPSVHVNFRF